MKKIAIDYDITENGNGAYIATIFYEDGSEVEKEFSCYSKAESWKDDLFIK